LGGSHYSGLPSCIIGCPFAEQDWEWAKEVGREEVRREGMGKIFV